MATPTSADEVATVGALADLRRWLRASPAPRFTNALGVRVAVIYAFTAFAFAGVANLVAVGLGEPLHLAGSVTSRPALLDAVWHAGAGLIMVLPARNLRLCLFGPILATEIDIDHLFGAYIPTVVERPAHDLFFLVLVVLLFAVVVGRTGAFLVAAGTIGHLAVDGGGFPFLFPASRVSWSLPLLAEVAMAFLAVLLFFGAVRAWTGVERRSALAPVVLVTLGLTLLLVAGGPSLVQVAGV